MKKFSDIAALFADAADHKSGTAQPLGEAVDEQESTQTIFLAACEFIASNLRDDGFRYLENARCARRTVAGFSHDLQFQTSRDNVRGEYIALWIQVGVGSDRLDVWRKSTGQPGLGGFAGAEIGHLEVPPGWREWNLGEPRGRHTEIASAISCIRTLALPYFEPFLEDGKTLERLSRGMLRAVDPPQAVEFALAYENVGLARELVQRFLAERPELGAAYMEALVEFRQTGVPPQRHLSCAKDLARATILYDLGAPS